MLKRLLIVIAFLLPLAPLLAFSLLETGAASNQLAALEQLEPQSAAQLDALPDGSEVLIEGRIDPQNTRSLGSLMVYIAEDYYEDRYLEADMTGRWYASLVTPPFVIALPDSMVRVINQDYVLKNPLHTIERNSRLRLSGLAPGDRVTVMGIVTHDVSGAAVQAKIVAGGAPADYLALQQRSAVAPLALAAFFTLILVVLGLGLWLARAQTQRQAHGTA